MKAFLLQNEQGMQVTLLEYGARVSSILFPVNGTLTEMTLGYRDNSQYLQDDFYLGASVGRVCNRIAQGQFILNGTHYQLSQNSGAHCLHGGEIGFSQQYWQVDSESISAQSIIFSLLSKEDDQGFPGELIVKIKYTLTDENSLVIDFTGLASATTLINLCNHCYFHLGDNSINDLALYINADDYLPIDNTGIPLGKPKPVAKSDFDFSKETLVFDKLTNSTEQQIITNKGFDHCYVLSSNKNSDLKANAVLISRKSGVQLSVYTDQLGMQLYTGQYLSGDFKPYQALCLEAQHFPDAINNPYLSSPIVETGKRYSKQVKYQFTLVR
ncbi:aldose epimerase family protein [Litorilituus sediminis]|uniref:Aldose 1-epimerase n=1 Tax=Litorilituus sediminis TaxID=718192 RepID=A0A4P6P6Q6_9GAMM|nr:aldose epimerase family protein [Litorilituus sediminis]QBG35065.1 galactose mutarotase [Litorilituus sediminis]